MKHHEILFPQKEKKVLCARDRGLIWNVTPSINPSKRGSFRAQVLYMFTKKILMESLNKR